MIDRNIAQPKYLTVLVQAEPELELVAPTEINVVCLRYLGEPTDEAAIRALNTDMMLAMQETGIAVPSDTTVAGKHCLRGAIVNHRTRRKDLDLFGKETVRRG